MGCRLFLFSLLGVSLWFMLTGDLFYSMFMFVTLADANFGLVGCRWVACLGWFCCFDLFALILF